MKKFLALLLVLVLACSVATSFAEETTASESKFEAVLLKEGSLFLKEWVDYCEIDLSDTYVRIMFQTARVVDIETGKEYHALRMDYGYGKVIGVMDADEIDGAITTLEYVKNHIYELKDYSEVVYTAAGGVEVGGYHKGKENVVFIRFNSKVPYTFDAKFVDELINAFKGVKATFAQ
ncbi:MAG: hypothetical protein MR914_09060 [Clostridiales bacterium]|nr:hypothetical protein [Clostridiales bacterium]